MVNLGTHNPAIDVPAVQAAVNLGGEVSLKGPFSFDTTPTVHTAFDAAGYPRAMVLISKEVAISGVRGDDEMTSIDPQAKGIAVFSQVPQGWRRVPLSRITM